MLSLAVCIPYAVETSRCESASDGDDDRHVFGTEVWEEFCQFFGARWVGRSGGLVTKARLLALEEPSLLGFDECVVSLGVWVMGPVV